ncbi:glucan endo-13-beta-glucosidase eglC protein [Rutstroemia sp. NJR-2017a BBW]|nr:glucan endo-13-beta-glucosidase eglC protein [Rutstroemia sp. NJR-2017a BBW]
MLSKTILALAASLSTVSAVNQGFNYGATNADGSYRSQQDFQNAFEAAQSLVGTSGFTSARLYTMIQGGSSTNEPTSAIQAAIDSDTTLLLGLWASGGQAGMDAEITALKSAIQLYGEKFTSRVVGISVGSEDLYRNSPTGIAAKSGYGANPDDLVHYISQVKTAIAGTGLSGASIGHVDTWTAWVNGSNSAVTAAVDWVGMDAYPYFQSTEANGISEGKSLFNAALAATQSAAGGKDVWITETGWPVTGATEGQGEASTANAKTYWDDVGCPNFGKVNMYWYTLQDQNAGGSVSPSFGIVGSTLSTTPLFDLSCSQSNNSSSASSTASGALASSASALVSQATGGAVASSGSGLSPSGMGNGIVPSGTAASGYAAPSGTGSAGYGNGSNGTYTATTIRTAPAGSTATGSSGSGSGTSGSSGSSTTGSPSQSTNSASSLTGSVALALGAVFAVAAAL